MTAPSAVATTATPVTTRLIIGEREMFLRLRDNVWRQFGGRESTVPLADGEAFQSLEEAKRRMLRLSHRAELSDLCLTEEELAAEWDSIFPHDADIVEFQYRKDCGVIGLTWTQRPPGYTMLWQDFSQDYRVSGIARTMLMMRVPLSGKVRCPRKFFRRINELRGQVSIPQLSKTHGVRIELVLQ